MNKRMLAFWLLPAACYLTTILPYYFLPTSYFLLLSSYSPSFPPKSPQNKFPPHPVASDVFFPKFGVREIYTMEEEKK